ncbi:MAG: PD-(D/E)XK motif protein [Flavobacteriales bacterium]|nr:PD-(D/E)XK motif protein [Flavobacteriales bacterium]MBK7942559.1 PD-(D/E)XK motif protein [Flavobacteriales bacterium]MBK9699042.1 PD-(D/E)XK motif protein [Flavobacteriales bacterium]
MVVLHGGNKVLVEMFLRFALALAEQISAQPTPSTVAALIQRFVTLLQSLRRPNAKVIQGLWAELFVMTAQSDSGAWVIGWHTDPMSLHDFVLGARRVEVKSSATGERVHRFSHRQLSPTAETSLHVASVLVERIGQGSSVFNLAEELHRRLSPEQSLVLDNGIAAALGADYFKAEQHRFDESRARGSLRYFPLSVIPRLQADVPTGVSEISYTVRLSDVDGETVLVLA